MPSFRHGRQTAVVYGAYDLSQFLNQADVSRPIAMGDTTAFGNNDKTYIPGLQDGKITAKGMLTGAAGEIDAVLDAAAGQDVGTPILVAQDGGLVVGRRCKIASTKIANLGSSAVVSDVVKCDAEFQADGGVRGGDILAAATAVATATTVNGTTVDDGALSANGGYAQVHVTANTWSGTTTIKVQHSVDGSTWVDLATFSVVTAATTTSERVSVAAGTTVNRYLRSVITTGAGAGSVTVTAAFARN